MKKNILTLVAVVSIGLTACGQPNEESNKEPRGNTEQAEDKQETKKVDLKNAEEIIAALKEKGAPIGEMQVYTAENDPNELLGRPNGYIGKISFIDADVEKKKIEENLNEFDMSEEETKKEMREEFGVEYGGSIEVFENEKDAKNRYEYVSTVSSEMGAMFVEYGYVEKTVYLRLSKSLTPAQASVYENALKEITK